METPAGKKPLGERVKGAIGIEGDTKTLLKPMLSYASAFISWEGSLYMLNLYYLAYLTYVEGLSTGQASIIIMIKSIWDAVTDPVMGIVTDRTRSRFGRHRRYILLGVIPFGVAFFMMWYSFGISSLGNPTYTMLYYLVAYMLYSTVVTLIFVPHAAMLPELAPGYFQRTQYNSVGMLMNSVGQIFSFLLVAMSTGGLASTDEFTPDMRGTFMRLGLFLAIFYMVPILLCFLFTKEPNSLRMEVPKLDRTYIWKEYKQAFSNKAFLQFFLIFGFVWFFRGLFDNSKIYFISEAADKWSYYNLLITVGGIAQMAGFPINYALTKKFGKQKCSWVITPILLIGLSLGFFIRPDAEGAFPIGTVLLFLQTICYNFGFSGILFTANNILPDVTDVDEMITGRRREGVLSSTSTFIKKAAVGLVAGLVGILLEWFGVSVNDSEGMLGNVRTAPELLGDFFGSEFGLRFVHAFLPIVCVIGALLVLRKYRMTKQDHAMITAAIKLKRATGSVTLLPEQAERCEAIAGHKMEEMWLGRDNTEDQPLVLGSDGKYILPEEAAAEETEKDGIE